MKVIRIGTRGSQLALWQANHVRQALLAAYPQLRVEVEVITTRGDVIVDAVLSKIEGKGLFTKEIEQALHQGRVDLAVHSLKDLPTQLPEGLSLAAILPREDPAEAFIALSARSIDALPSGASVMTGSIRRGAQLLHMRADLKVLPIRGNVPTRLRKFDESGADGLILAMAGMKRLGLAGRVAQRLEPSEFLPACGQGAMAVETRDDDAVARDICGILDDASTRMCVTAERAYLQAMGGGCQAPVGAWGRIEADGKLVLSGFAASTDGRHYVRDEVAVVGNDLQSATQLGHDLAARIRAQGIDDILLELAGQPKLSREDA